MLLLLTRILEEVTNDIIDSSIVTDFYSDDSHKKAQDTNLCRRLLDFRLECRKDSHIHSWVNQMPDGHIR